MKITITTLSIIIAFAASAQYQWAVTGGSAFGFSTSRSVATDPSGNIYAIGDFEGTVDFDPSAGTHNLTSNGGPDIFIAKYNSSGALQWVHNFGGTSTSSVEEEGWAITADLSGNIYFTGIFEGTTDFDPSSGTANLTSVTNRDVFVSKFDTDGNYQWAFQIAANGYGTGIALDASGNLLVSGSFSGTVDFDPSGTTANMTSTGSGDFFVAKYNSAGVYQWAISSSSSSGYPSAFPYSITTDASDNVIITGKLNGTKDFDYSVANADLTTNGGDDIFVAKYNSSGAYQWGFSIGGSGDETGSSVKVDISGNIYITGGFESSMDFDPAIPTYDISNFGNEDIYIAKYSPAGAFIWAEAIRDVNYEWAETGFIDASGNFYITGSFQGTLDFDPKTDIKNLTSAGGNDVFVAKYSTDGDYVWAVNMGGTSDDDGVGIMLDVNSDIIVSGSFQGTADFNPGTGTNNSTAIGDNDFFVVKLDQDVISSVKNPIDNISFKLFPNPSANGQFFIETDQKFTEIELVNMIGQKEKHYGLTISTNLKGLVFVNMKTADGVFSRLIEIQ